MKVQSRQLPAINALDTRRDDAKTGTAPIAKPRKKIEPGPTAGMWEKAQDGATVLAKRQGLGEAPDAKRAPGSGNAMRDVDPATSEDPSAVLARRLSIRPTEVEPEAESFWEIVKDTFKDPGGRLGQSITHIYHLAKDGRYATPEEVQEARRIGSYFNVPLKMVSPPLGVGGSIADTAEAAEKAARGEKIDAGILIDALPLPEGLPRPATTARSSARGIPAPNDALPAASSSKLKGSFRPPTRLEDGRIGYTLSPTHPPRLARRGPIDKDVSKRLAGARQATLHPSRAPAATPDVPPPAAGPSTSSPSPPRGSGPGTAGKQQFKEFARTEVYEKVTVEGMYEPLFKHLSRDIDGYTSNYRGKGYEAIALHGTPAGSGNAHLLSYKRGHEIIISNDPNSDMARGMDFSREVTPRELVHHLRRDHQLDLVSPALGGRGRSDPLYLLACHATANKRESLAQQLADATGRQVRAHSDYEIWIPSPENLENRHSVVEASVSHPNLKWITRRNRLRLNSREPDQLVHKKFNPRSRPEPDVPTTAAGTAPIQTHPRPDA